MKNRTLKGTAYFLVLAMLLQACGNKEQPAETEASSQSVQETVKETEPATEAPIVTEAPAETEVPEETEPAETEPEQTEEADPFAPILIRKDSTRSDVSQADADDYRCFAYLIIENGVVFTPGYEALQQAMDEEAQSRIQSGESYKEQVLERVGDMGMDFFAGMSPWEYEDSIQIARADAKVVSYMREVYSYLGGAHPNSVYVSSTYDSATGRVLELADVTADFEGLKEAIQSEMVAEYGEYLNENWKETFDRIFAGEDDYATVNWTISATDIHVIFNPYVFGPYAMGAVDVTIPFDKYPGLVKEEYIPVGRLLCAPVKDFAENYNLEYRVDTNGDGKEEIVQIEMTSYWDEDYSYVEHVDYSVLLYGGDGESYTSTTRSAQFAPKNFYVMQTPGGRTYLYMVIPDLNGIEYLEVYDVSDPIKGVEIVGYNSSGSFQDVLPQDPKYVFLSENLNVMGSFIGTWECQIGEDGLFVPYEPVYKFRSYTGRIMTTKLEVKAQCYGSLEERDHAEDRVLPAGTTLEPIQSDGSSYVTFRLEDGTYADIYYDNDEWPRTIGGVNEMELFDNIIYAG